MDDYLCIRFGSENVAVSFQLLPELREVINFAVENHPNGFFRIRHGLMTSREINNRESAEAEPEWSRDVIPLIIGPPMDEAPGHPLDIPTTNGKLSPKVILSANA